MDLLKKISFGEFMIKKFFKIIIYLFIFNINNIFAIETINIERATIDPVPIAINMFDTNNIDTNIIAKNIVSVISNDLKISGLFRPISSSSFIEQKFGIKHQPLFAAWKQINANLIVNGEVISINKDKIRVSFILWDIMLMKDIYGEVLETSTNLWRRVAHKISDKIYEKITGDQGYFDTKVTYVAESGPYLKRVKRIAIMDYDGANHQYLTNGKALALTPRLSPKSDKLMYVSYLGKKPKIYIRDLKTGREKIMGDLPFMSFAPRFSPDGSKAIMSIAKNGSTHIFEMDLNNMKLTQLTNGIAINTSPSYSPDGMKLVFNSDRSGSRQLYIMNRDGSNVERISFSSGYYTSPVWSPNGDYIAFTKMTRTEGFTIGIMRIDKNNQSVVSGGERMIARGYLVEGPVWAPNGRIIMFAKSFKLQGKTQGISSIYSIDINGYNERMLKTPSDASDPEWSMTLD